MVRAIPEWIAKHDDQAIPARVKLRIVERQVGKCAITGVAFTPSIKPEFDHIIALADGGDHKESNLHAIIEAAHKAKTRDEAGKRAKARTSRKKHLGLSTKPQSIKSQGFSNSRWKYSAARGCWIDRETKKCAPHSIQRKMSK